MKPTPTGERFPRWVRLRRRSEFKRVYDGGRKCVRRFLVVYVAPAAEPPDGAPASASPTRLGITASRRVGKATVRNRIRRRVRELYRRWHSSLAPGHDIVVNARVAARDATFEQLARDLSGCLEELGLADAPLRPCWPRRASCDED